MNGTPHVDIHANVAKDTIAPVDVVANIRKDGVIICIKQKIIYCQQKGCFNKVAVHEYNGYYDLFRCPIHYIGKDGKVLEISVVGKDPVPGQYTRCITDNCGAFYKVMKFHTFKRKCPVCEPHSKKKGEKKKNVGN